MLSIKDKELNLLKTILWAVNNLDSIFAEKLISALVKKNNISYIMHEEIYKYNIDKKIQLICKIDEERRNEFKNTKAYKDLKFLIKCRNKIAHSNIFQIKNNKLTVVNRGKKIPLDLEKLNRILDFESKSLVNIIDEITLIFLEETIDKNNLI